MKEWKISTAYIDVTGGLAVEVPAFGEEEECVYPEWIECDGKVYEIDDEELLKEVLEHTERFVLREWRDNQYFYHYYLFR